MKEEWGVKMKGFQELHCAGTRRPKTAVWKIASTDIRRASFSKSAPGAGASFESQIFVNRFPSSSSFRTSQLSSASDLQRSSSSCPACSTLTKMMVSPAQFDTSSTATSDLQLHSSRWNSSCHESVLSLENGTQGSFPAVPSIDVSTSGRKGGKLPHIHGPCDFPRFTSTVDGSPTSPSTPYQNVKVGTHAEQASVEPKPPWYIAVLNEKERCLLTLGEEVTRLTKVEAECMKKDHIIAALLQEVRKLNGQLYQIMTVESCREKEDTAIPPAGEAYEDWVTVGDTPRENSAADIGEVVGDLNFNLSQYHPALGEEAESELDGVYECWAEEQDEHLQVGEEPPETQRPISSQAQSDGSCSLGDLGGGENDKGTQTEDDWVWAELEKLQDLNQKLEAELDKVKKDYDMSTGVVSSLQRQYSFQESLLRKSESALIRLHKEFKERGVQLQAMSTKFSNLREERKHEEMMAEIESANFSLRQCVSELTSELEKRNTIIGGQKSEIHTLQAEKATNQDQLKKSLSYRTQAQSKAEALELSEQQAKVALEATNSKFERFRGKIMQATYGTPGAKPPLTEISDDEILEAMQKIIADRTDFHQQLKLKGVKVPPLSLAEAPVVPIVPKHSVVLKKSTVKKDS